MNDDRMFQIAQQNMMNQIARDQMQRGYAERPRPASVVDDLKERAAKLRLRMIEAERDRKELETIERMLAAAEPAGEGECYP